MSNFNHRRMENKAIRTRRMVVVAVLAGKRPVDVLGMTYLQHALSGSGGYFPVDVDDVMTVMASG